MKQARTEMQRKRSLTNDLGIVPIKNIVHPRSWAIYGRSGSGKTTFAGTFPKPALLLDIRDKGTDSISDLDKVDYKEIKSMDDVEEMYYFLKENPGEYKTVIFDTITQLQQMIVEEVSAKKRKKNETDGLAGDWGSMSKREWAEVAAKLKEWILNYRDLPMEVVFLAQEKVNRGSEEDDDNPDRMLTPEIGPQVIPSVAGHLNAAVAVIGNTFVRSVTSRKTVNGKEVKKENVQYSLRIGPNPIYTTKLRKPRGVVPPPLIDDPSYKDVLDAMKNGE